MAKRSTYVDSVVALTTRALSEHISEYLTGDRHSNEWRELPKLLAPDGEWWSQSAELREVHALLALLMIDVPGYGRIFEVSGGQMHSIESMGTILRGWQAPSSAMDDLDIDVLIEQLTGVLLGLNLNDAVSELRVLSAEESAGPEETSNARYEESIDTHGRVMSGADHPPDQTSIRINVHGSNVLNPATLRSMGDRYSAMHMIDHVEITSQDWSGTATLDVSFASGGRLISVPQEIIVQVDRGITRVDGIAIEFEPEKLAELASSLDAQLVVMLNYGPTPVAELRQSIRILPSQQWQGADDAFGAETLAAFVLPQDLAIHELLKSANDVFQQQTTSSIFEVAYAPNAGSAAERVDRIVECIYDAMARMDMKLLEEGWTWRGTPPEGIQIRTPSEVLASRMGSRAEITLTLASALEAAGINAAIFLESTRVFLGYFRYTARLRNIATFEFGEARAKLQTDSLRLVDPVALTTHARASLTDGAAQIRWELATAGSRPHGQAARLVVDLQAARLAGTYPSVVSRRADPHGSSVNDYAELPLNLLGKPQIKVAVNNIPVQLPTIAKTGSRIVGAQAGADISRVSRVEQWKKQLLDLSFRNKLLNFAPRARFPLAIPRDALADFIGLLEEEATFVVLPSQQLDFGSIAEKCSAVSQPNARRRELLIKSRRIQLPLDADKFNRQLRSIQRTAQTEAQESGANSLFLSVGTLHWTLDGSTHVSPLVLVPAVLTALDDVRFKVAMDSAGTVQPNLCLMEKLRVEFDIEMRELSDDASRSKNFDLENFLAAVSEKLKSTGAVFEIERSVDLANLQFAKFGLWKDLDDHWSQLSRNAVVNHLTKGRGGSYTDKPSQRSLGQPVDLDVLAEECPLPADATQLTAVSRAVNGETFILEGPPGTGKSQTITNMIAVAMAQGKSVLFVAEKRAALDVVKRRLEAAGLGKYTLDLHDKHARISHVRRQIRVALEHKGQGKEGIDDGLPEKLRRARHKLSTYANNLHEANSHGFSLYSARTQQLAVNDSVTALPIPAQFVNQQTPVTIQRVRQQLDELAATAAMAKPAIRHPWGFIEVPVPDNLLPRILEAAKAYTDSLESIVSATSAPDVVQIVESSLSALNFQFIAEILRAGVSIRLLGKVSAPKWAESSLSFLMRFEEILSTPSPLGKTFTTDVLELALDRFIAEAETAVQSGFMGIGRKKNVRAVIESLGGTWTGSATDEASVDESLRKVRTWREKIQDLSRDINAQEGLELPEGWKALSAQNFDDLKRRVEMLTQASNTWAALKKTEKFTVLSAVERLVDLDTERHRAADHLLSFATNWEILLEQIPGTNEAMNRWTAGHPLATSWLKTDWQRRTDWSGERDLRAWNSFQRALKPIRDAGLEKAVSLLGNGSYPVENAVMGFDRGLAGALVSERMSSTELNKFNAADHERQIDEFNQRSEQMRQQMSRSIPEGIIRTRETTSVLNLNRAKLLRQAIKPAGMSTRELMSTYSDVITRVMPCTLVSPDSVARYFPAEAGMFDLVIFDEASQIRVADSLGAMGRAKTVVVVGDSQQMPPTSVGVAAHQEESGGLDEIVVDEESILRECEQAGIPRLWLSGHYRSQSESLIAFSNQHFYENRLTTFPAPRTEIGEQKEKGYGISLVRVEGRFYRSSDTVIDAKLKRTNPIEARTVVDAIKLRFAESPRVVPSLGVITLNAQQRDLIEGMLRDDNDGRLEEALDSDDGLFVKNLENVQGDERDTIYFSTAFSPNASGVLPLNFGPLNNAGGERRLNVAVTRARKEVIVFSSFAPEQLRAENSESVGIKRLRDYLDLAQKGAAAVAGNSPGTRRVDRHREQIAQQLRARGMNVRTAVGLSNFKIDLVVSSPERPDKPLVAVLLDGEDWAERKTVGDRDGLPQQVLTNVLGWPATMRIWMPDWHSNANAVCNRVRSKVAIALRELGRREVQQKRLEVAADVEQAPVEKRARAVDVVDRMGVNRQCTVTPGHKRVPPGMDPLFSQDLFEPSRIPSGTQIAPSSTVRQQETMSGEVKAYKAWRFRFAGYPEELDDLSNKRVTTRVRKLLGEIIDAEWPIQSQRLGILANRAFWLSKVSMEREMAIIQLLESEKYKRDSEGFIWPQEINVDRWRGYRTGVVLESDMTMTKISPTEIANAMQAVLTEQGPLKRDDLFRATAIVFGGKRLPTSGSAAWIEKGLNVALHRKSIRPRAEVYELVH